MTTLRFWKSLAQQAVAVMAATALGSLPAAALLGEFDWKLYGLSILLSGAAVALKGLAASQIGDHTTPNFRK